MRPPAAPRILVDSSLWIEYYRPDGRRHRREVVQDALAQDRVATSAIILIEVLQGATTLEAYDALREDFAALHWLDLTRATAEQAARVGCDLRRRGETVPATDLMIAAIALDHECQLWHLDDHFERIARVVPLQQRKFR